ncbi:hypothetical protein Hanom_Chr09g00775031 [Helianthus anomalus]
MKCSWLAYEDSQKVIRYYQSITTYKFKPISKYITNLSHLQPIITNLTETKNRNPKIKLQIE